MKIIEENSCNWLIMTKDGSTTTKTKSSNLNQLLYGHNLAGLLETGNSIWVHEGSDDSPRVMIVPDENAENYTISVGDAPELHIGNHRKTDIIDALTDVCEADEETAKPIINLYDEIRDNMIRKDILSAFLDVFGEKVACRDSGWYIHNHLLLTYEGDFYHPDNVSRNRSGRVIGEGVAVSAYEVDIGDITDQMNREISHEEETYRLTNSEVEFLAKVIWAIKNTTEVNE